MRLHGLLGFFLLSYELMLFSFLCLSYLPICKSFIYNLQLFSQIFLLLHTLTKNLLSIHLYSVLKACWLISHRIYFTFLISLIYLYSHTLGFRKFSRDCIHIFKLARSVFGQSDTDLS